MLRATSALLWLTLLVSSQVLFVMCGIRCSLRGVSSEPNVSHLTSQWQTTDHRRAGAVETISTTGLRHPCSGKRCPLQSEMMPANRITLGPLDMSSALAVLPTVHDVAILRVAGRSQASSKWRPPLDSAFRAVLNIRV